MNIAIIGAGRTRNGIGQYIAKYFHLHGVQVAAVVGSTDESARHAAENLSQYGIRAGSFSDFDSMVRRHRPDAVVIASPAHTHRNYISRALNAGAHIFCEKPFVWPPASHGELEEQIFRPAKQQNITVAMNSQWPFALPSYRKLCGHVTETGDHSFRIIMQPACTGIDMIPDALPHALSLLYCVFGPGTICDIETAFGSDDAAVRCFYTTDRARCAANITLTQKNEQPRAFAFGFDGKTVTRVLDPESYAISFSCGSSCCRVPDPLELSVCDFIASVERGTPPGIAPDHISCTNALLREIFTCARAHNTQPQKYVHND
jgi:hypothetical protein